MPTDLPPDLQLTPLTADARTVAEWTTNFHLAMVVLDPESAWILDTAGRLLREYAPADCRTCFLVTGSAEEAKQFLGPWALEFLTFVDPERVAVTAMGIERLPAFLHINQRPAVESHAEGWSPEEWREVADELSRYMGWTRVTFPRAGDPAPYEGTLALG